MTRAATIRGNCSELSMSLSFRSTPEWDDSPKHLKVNSRMSRLPDRKDRALPGIQSVTPLNPRNSMIDSSRLSWTSETHFLKLSFALGIVGQYQGLYPSKSACQSPGFPICASPTCKSAKSKCILLNPRAKAQTQAKIESVSAILVDYHDESTLGEAAQEISQSAASCRAGVPTKVIIHDYYVSLVSLMAFSAAIRFRPTFM